jgi:triosephosphate isomerase
MVVGNWKMYTRAADANVLATTVRNYVAGIDGVEVVICPPVIWLSEVINIVGRGGKIELGAQNMFYEAEGAYTGEISPLMIRDLAKYVIIGHSERREHFCETDLDVNEKVIAALKAGLSPIICVGEKKKSTQYPNGVVQELKEALKHVPKKNYRDITVAYEPIWAISTAENRDRNADVEYVVKVISALREIVLRDSPILYGGSVNSKNAKEYAERPEIDGALVGAASLRAADFVKVCEIWADAKNFKNDVK